MNESYDPDHEVDSAWWLECDEADRRTLVTAAHERTGSPTGENATLHAIIHVIVENRLAANEEAIRRAYDRLRAAEIDRHSTIHALGSVVAAQIHAALASREPGEDTAAFDAIDPADWRVPPPRNAHVARQYRGRQPKRRPKR